MVTIESSSAPMRADCGEVGRDEIRQHSRTATATATADKAACPARSSSRDRGPYPFVTVLARPVILSGYAP